MKKEYIDLQVNGFAGVDFSTLELDYDSFMKAAEKVFSTGTAVFLPTIVTSDVPLYERNISIIKNAVEKNGLEKAVPGVHLEGPYINKSKAGAQPEEYIVNPTIEEFKEYIIQKITEQDGILDNPKPNLFAKEITFEDLYNKVYNISKK